MILFAVFLIGYQQSSEEFIRDYAKKESNVSIRNLGDIGWGLKLTNKPQVLSDLLPHLRNCDKRLTSIKIYGIDINDRHLHQLLNSPVRSLWIVKGTVNVSRENLRLDKQSRLKILELSKTDIMGSLASTLKQLDALVELDLTGTTFVGNHLKSAIFGEHVFSNIEKLNLDYCDISDQDLKSVSRQLPNLKWFGIHATNVTGPGLSNLSSFHLLETVQVPDGISIEDGLQARLKHVDAKRAARRQGLAVPPDEKSPFSSFESRAMEKISISRLQLREKSGMSFQKAKQIGLVEWRFVNLLGREKALVVIKQVDAIVKKKQIDRNYVSDLRSIGAILKQDFGLSFENPLPAGVGHAIKSPENWGRLPEKTLRFYLSGELDRSIL
ncbi:MAG: hypothetical protein AAGA30_04645, partial [Planctomycetota bacterium]